jgi:hypothetical protein
LANIGFTQRRMDPEPFVVGLWLGKSKPNDSNEYLNNFVTELKDLHVHGINFNDKHYALSQENTI